VEPPDHRQSDHIDGQVGRRRRSGDRYEYLNDDEASRESVDVGRAAIAADPGLVMTVANQAVSLRELFLRTREAAMLEESLAAHVPVLRATPDAHASLPRRGGAGTQTTSVGGSVAKTASPPERAVMTTPKLTVHQRSRTSARIWRN
jgi:hypothetical protein